MKTKTRSSVATCCFMAVALLTVHAQDKSTSVKAVQRLNRAPVSRDVLRVSLPRPVELKLSNGLTLLVLERHKLPTFTASLWIESGALNDPKDLPGLANFTADMLREGTAKRTSEQISQELDMMGAELGVEATFGQAVTKVDASGLVTSADHLMELMSDIVIHPSFPQSELEKYKKRRQTELEEQRSQPGFLAREKFYRVIYQDFPASVIAPSLQSLEAVRAEDLRRYHDANYSPNNAILGIAGDLTVEQAKALAERWFGTWANHPVNTLQLPPLPPRGGRKIYFVDRPGSVQTDIRLGNYSLKRDDPDYIPMKVLNRILGGGAAARLFLNLREEKGYTYGAYSSVTGNLYPGVFVALTQVRNAVTDGSMHELLGELQRIRDESVPPSELEEVERSIIAQFALSLEDPHDLLNYWFTVKYYGFPMDYWDRYSEEIAKVTPEKIQEVARKYITLDHLQIVCVGDGRQVESVLQKYGVIEMTDANGKPLRPYSPSGSQD